MVLFLGGYLGRNRVPYKIEYFLKLIFLYFFKYIKKNLIYFQKKTLKMCKINPFPFFLSLFVMLHAITKFLVFFHSLNSQIV
jgi:hypothetical protein